MHPFKHHGFAVSANFRPVKCRALNLPVDVKMSSDKNLRIQFCKRRDAKGLIVRKINVLRVAWRLSIRVDHGCAKNKTLR